MRSAIVQLTVLTLSVVLANAGAEARATPSDKLLCKQVRDALAAGRTLDQIVAELHIDADHVAKCVQPRARRGAKRKSSKPSSAGKSHKGVAPSAPAARDRGAESTAPTSPPPRSRSPSGMFNRRVFGPGCPAAIA